MNPDKPTPDQPGALSSSALDSLMAAAAHSPPPPLPPPEPAAPAPSPVSDGPQPHDFRTPMLLPPRELRRLRTHQEEFVTALAARLSLYLRLEVPLKLAGLQTITYRKFSETWADPSHLALCKLEPLRGIAVLEIPPRLALGMVDRLMGGPGQSADPAPEISEIERALLEPLEQLILGEWCAHWSKQRELKPVLLGHETSGRYVQIATAESIMFVLSLETVIGGCTDKIKFGIPFAAVEPLFQQLTRSSEITDNAPAIAKPALRWNPAFDDLTVPLTAEWQGIELSARDVVALKVGDVVPFGPQTVQSVNVRLGERVRFVGRPGTIAGQWAIELTRVLNDQPANH